MKRLFLASAFGDVAEKLPWGLLDRAANLRVGFVTTAANPYSTAPYQEKDKKKLQEQGFTVVDIDIEGKDREALRIIFKDIDVMFVAGGNTLYLLYCSRQSGFDALVREFVDSGKVYIGSSAGSIIMGPTKEPADPEQLAMVPGPVSCEAFHIINTRILPHTCGEYDWGNEKIKEEFSGRGYPILLLTDKQALIVEGDTETIIEA